MLLSTTYGRESFASPDRAAAITVYYKKNAGDDEPVPLFNAARDPQSGITMRNSSFVAASSLNDAHGSWTDATFNMTEGSYVKLWVQQKYESDFTYDNTYILLLMGQNAGLRRLGIRLTEHERAVRTWAYFEGKFDVIDPHWFERMGVTFFPREDYANADYLQASDKFRLETLEAGAPFAPPQLEAIQTRSGATVQVNTRSRRVIRIGNTPTRRP